MPEIKAHLKYLRISPRKVRTVAGVMSGKSASLADVQLKFMNKDAALPLRKLLRSAMANAKHNFNIEPGTLMIQSVRVDQGPTLKRSMPRARGMATPIHKRTSHVSIVLTEITKKDK